MAHPDYWKFCALLGRIDQAIQRAVAAKAQLYAEHGLSPDQDYDLNDAEETITPKQRNG